MIRPSIKELAKTSEDILETSEAYQLRGSRGLLYIIESLRDHIRKDCEYKPLISDQIEKDIRFKLGAVWVLNTILDFPREAKEYLNSLPEQGDNQL